MSRAFVKEDSGDGIEDLPDLPISPHPNYVTPTGHAALRTRLHDARTEAARLGPRKEEIDARQRLAILRRDIRYLERRLASAIPVDLAAQPSGRVAFGASVTVIDDDDREQTFRIVGEDEADPERGRIAPSSPLARALMGASEGDSVTWPKPVGAVDLEITAIRYFPQ